MCLRTLIAFQLRPGWVHTDLLQSRVVRQESGDDLAPVVQAVQELAFVRGQRQDDRETFTHLVHEAPGPVFNFA